MLVSKSLSSQASQLVSQLDNKYKTNNKLHPPTPKETESKGK